PPHPRRRHLQIPQRRTRIQTMDRRSPTRRRRALSIEGKGIKMKVMVDLISVDPDVLGGTPVFKGTRVPVRTLFEYLEDNYTLDQFLESFPAVTKKMAVAILDASENAVISRKTA